MGMPTIGISTKTKQDFEKLLVYGESADKGLARIINEYMKLKDWRNNYKDCS